jgi:dCMP deaminase
MQLKEKAMSDNSWDSLNMKIAALYSQKAKCASLKVGCVLVKDNRVISVGYNGEVSGLKNCPGESCKFKDESGQLRCGGETLHAEENAIIFAAKTGISIQGCTAYCTHLPCRFCMKRLIQAGISRVVYGEPYRDLEGINIAGRAGIICEKYEEENDH